MLHSYAPSQLEQELHDAKEAAKAAAAQSTPPGPSEATTLQAEIDEARAAALAALPLGTHISPTGGLADLVRIVIEAAGKSAQQQDDAAVTAIREELMAARSQNQRI